MNIPVKTGGYAVNGDKPPQLTTNSSIKAISDMLYIYKSQQMYINEKSYTMRLIENLYELGYYINNEELFKE